MAEEAVKLRELITREKEIESIKEKNNALDEKSIQLQERKLNLEQQYLDALDDGRTNANKMYKSTQERLKIVEKTKNSNSNLSKILESNANFVDITNKSAKSLGDSIEGAVNSIPFVGETLKRNLGLEDFGERLEGVAMKSIKRSLQQGKSATATITGLGKAVAGTLRGLLGPIGLAIAGFTAIFALVRKIRQANRDLAGDLGISTSQAMKFRAGITLAETQFKLMGLDSTKIKTTMNEIGKEFGSLENMTARNAANIEKFAQNNSIAGTEIVKFNKVMMDLTGSSFSVATNMAETAANMAKSANVSTAKVLGDITSAAEDFARYSMSGAEGLAQAAVEAAKVGSSLSTTLKVADSLLSFEEAIGAQFKAQVLTGRQINTERARQLALDGDIAGLTQEIQSIVGGVGDLQTLNVIQRKSVAEAIGISVGELMRISRGEQVQQQVTVQDKLDITNKLLSTQNSEASKFYATQQGTKKVEMQQPTF